MEITGFTTPHTCNDGWLHPHQAHTTVTHNREALHKCMEEMALGLTILETKSTHKLEALPRMLTMKRGGALFLAFLGDYISQFWFRMANPCLKKG